MKSLTLSLVLALACLLFTGCSAETTAGGIGLGAGIGLSETIRGMQADLDKREATLVQRYNDLLAAGAKAEDLEQVKQQIEQTVRLRQGVQTGERFLGTDWKNPQEAATRVGEGIFFLWLLLNRRKLGQKYVAAKTGQAKLKEVDPAAEAKLYSLIGTERTARGL